ncbi:hypothetical protein CPB85DRAFT_1341276 [Mucidula mucida]|nr:hypothetical protein CPB85DRAFT_1341276 [Mucidula mucida]
MSQQIPLVTGSLVASGTLLIYDLLCTLDQEVEYVWSRPLAFSSILFFLNRYLPFVDTVLSIQLHLDYFTSEECITRFKALTWFIVVGLLLCEAILMIRTYAIWERRRAVLYGFIALFLVVAIPGIVMTQLELDSLVYGPVSDRGCRLIHASPIIMGSYLLLLLCETIIAVLMCIKAWQHLRQPHSSWVNRLYFQDGLLFFIYTFFISLANVIVPICNPSLANWLATPQRVLHSIFSTRILLLIQSQKVNPPRSPTLFSSIFDSDINDYADTIPSSYQSVGPISPRTAELERVDTFELGARTS